MSISDLIKAQISEGRLCRLRPRRPHARWDRVILMVPELLDTVLHPSVEDQFRVALLWADLDRFSEGGNIVVGSGEHPSCYMKQLEPWTDEVWEIRSRDPKPSLRAFGRFCLTDVYFVSSLRRRDEMGGWGDREWRDEIVRCQAIWRQLFHTYPPQSGNDIHDYISDRVFDERGT